MQSIEQELIVDGETVVTRRLLRGTHQGLFMGIALTGKEVTAGGVWLSHFSNGKIKEQWVYFDVLGMLQQVGVKLSGRRCPRSRNHLSLLKRFANIVVASTKGDLNQQQKLTLFATTAPRFSTAMLDHDAGALLAR